MNFRLKEAVASAWLAGELGLDHHGADARIAAVAGLGHAKEGDLSFASAAATGEAGSGAVLIRKPDASGGKGSAILSDNPRFAFIRALLVLEDRVGFQRDEAEPVIHPTAVIGRNAVIEPGVTIGAGTRIGHGAVLHGGTRIGARCKIGPNTVIGGEGFGFEKDEDGQPIRFIHLGGVVLEDEVEVGACTAIDRGTLGDTVVRARAKIDNLIHIAHNAIIGEDCLIIAGAEVSGGVRIGRGSWVGPNACIIDGISLGENVTVGLGAVVVKPVPDGTIVAGNPAEELSQFIRKRAAVGALIK